MILWGIYETKYGLTDSPKTSNLKELVITLNDIAKPKKPWTWRYLFNLIKGYKGFTLTSELQRACEIYAAELDGQSYWQARARIGEVTIFNGTNPNHAWLDPNTKILTCARPECDIRFIKTNPAMKYCPIHRVK